MKKSAFPFSNVMKTLILFGVILVVPNTIEGVRHVKFPDYIQLCKKSDPHLDQCILKATESFKQRFSKGVPELGVPPLDPLFVPHMVLFDGEKGGIKAIANNITVTGLKNFKVLNLKINLDALEYKMATFWPHLHFEGLYDVNAKFTNFQVKGRGPFAGNASEITLDATVKGKLVTVDDIQYIEFTSVQAHVTCKGYRIKVEKLFKDKQLNDAINQIINDPKVVPMEALEPLLNKVISKMWVDMGNKLLKNVPFDDLFATEDSQ